jgi:hypothetical protein
VVAISSGRNTAVPMAWMIRPVNSSPKPGAIAASTVPAVKSDIAVRKMVRRGNLRITKPVAGIRTARTSR